MLLMKKITLCVCHIFLKTTCKKKTNFEQTRANIRIGCLLNIRRTQSHLHVCHHKDNLGQTNKHRPINFLQYLEHPFKYTKLLSDNNYHYSLGGSLANQ